MKIKKITAKEILDSRGNPTLETTITLENGLLATSSVPSGASVGKYEALELRDNEPTRYRGMGVLKAVENVNKIIGPKLVGMEAKDQYQIDKVLILLDGTENKAKLGANAILSVSQAVCKAGALEKGVPVFVYVSLLYGLQEGKMKIPLPIFNLINGGKHGGGNLDFQEFHIIPSGEKSYWENFKMGEEIYQEVKKVLIQQKKTCNLGDEGGFAPNLATNSQALEILIKAISRLGYQFNKDVFLGIDAAAGFFYKEKQYKIRDKPAPINLDELIDYYQELNQQYPLKILEDPVFEDDWEGWAKITKALPKTTIVGDDLLATNKKRVQQAIKHKACSAIIIKPNQVGTITETLKVIKIAREAGWKIIVSHRSGETNDDFIADFAVGVGADYVKFGAPSQKERLVKYNRLLKISNDKASSSYHS